MRCGSFTVLYKMTSSEQELHRNGNSERETGCTVGRKHCYRHYIQPTADTYRQLQSANSRHIQTTTVSQQQTHTDNYSQPTVDTYRHYIQPTADTDNYSQPTADTYRQLQSANSRHIQTTTVSQQQTHTDNYSQPTVDTYRQLRSANSGHIQTTTVSQQWTHTDNYSQPTVDT